MPVTFVDQSNTAIQTLVDLCWTSLTNTNTASGLLFTPPLDILTQATNVLDDDYAEQDNDPLPPLTPPIQAYYFTPAKRLINDFIIRQKLFLRESVVFVRKPMVTTNASP